MATNSSIGTVLFSKTFNIANVQVGNNQARFLLNMPVSPYRLSADIKVTANGGVWSASVMVTRQLDINSRGSVDIVDFSTVAADFGSSLSSPRYNAVADLTGSGTISIIDVGILVVYYGATVFG
jgi:hypothetical protein